MTMLTISRVTSVRKFGEWHMAHGGMAVVRQITMAKGIYREAQHLQNQ
jgi:hypothetical protein